MLPVPATPPAMKLRLAKVGAVASTLPGTVAGGEFASSKPTKKLVVVTRVGRMFVAINVFVPALAITPETELLGLDVHKDSLVTAVAEAGPNGCIRRSASVPG